MDNVRFRVVLAHTKYGQACKIFAYFISLIKGFTMMASSPSDPDQEMVPPEILFSSSSGNSDALPWQITIFALYISDSAHNDSSPGSAASLSSKPLDSVRYTRSWCLNSPGRNRPCS